VGYTLGNYGISSAPQTSIGSQRFEQLVKSELALTAWRFGRPYGGAVASMMIAHTLGNRFRKGWGVWLDVIQNIPNHAAVLEMPIGFPNTWDKDFLKVLSEIDGVVDGTARDLSNGALYFADTRYITNESFLERIARNPLHQRVADCAGTLCFWS
jgi:hypothetical protein